MRSYKTILPFLKTRWKRYLFGIIMLMIVDAVNLLVPQIFRYFSDMAVGGLLNQDVLINIILAIVGSGLFMAIGRFIWRNAIYGTSRELEYWLRDKLMKKYLHLDEDYFSTHRTGDLMAHATNDVKNVRLSMGGGVMLLTDSIFMTTLSVVMMVATVGLKSAMVALISLPFLTLAVIAMSKPIRRRNRIVQDAFSDLTTEVQENLSGIRVIKAFASEKNRSESFAKINEEYQKKNNALVRLDALFNPLIRLISGFSFVIFIFYGAREVINGRMSLGDFIAINAYLNMIVWPLVALGMVSNRFQRGIASMSRLNEIFATQPRVKETEDPIPLDNPKGKIEFKNVSFRYRKDLPLVLDNISFINQPGESMAILGKTGSGKSTILELLLRRYDVTHGQILVDDIDIRDLSFDDLYDALAIVPQESFLFSRDIAENVAFSEIEPEKDRVLEATTFSQVIDDIEEMPDGFETIVGERGVTLSGGQKQRVSIARAYYKDSPVLILDDSLSAVDTETESRILDQLVQHDKGLIIVSQRVSTVKGVDQILVLEDGKIRQRGTHEELVQVDGFYQDLYNRQLLESAYDKKDQEVQREWEVEDED